MNSLTTSGQARLAGLASGVASVNSRDMCVGVSLSGFGMIVILGRAAETVDNPASVASGGALRTQLTQLRMQCLQFAHSECDMRDVLVKHFVDRFAIRLRSVLELQKQPDLVQGHIKASAMPDEPEAFNVVRSINAVVPLRTLRYGQEPFPLVKANRLNLCSAGKGYFADLHEFLRDWFFGRGA